MSIRYATCEITAASTNRRTGHRSSLLIFSGQSLHSNGRLASGCRSARSSVFHLGRISQAAPATRAEELNMEAIWEAEAGETEAASEGHEMLRTTGDLNLVLRKQNPDCQRLELGAC
uniref:Uncharacterized protein n=1 Tax=Oryza punctata TaxID=4537 RepID=A0A0E0K3J3_ORYPU